MTSSLFLLLHIQADPIFLTHHSRSKSLPVIPAKVVGRSHFNCPTDWQNKGSPGAEGPEWERCDHAYNALLMHANTRCNIECVPPVKEHSLSVSAICKIQYIPQIEIIISFRNFLQNYWFIGGDPGAYVLREFNAFSCLPVRMERGLVLRWILIGAMGLFCLYLCLPHPLCSLTPRAAPRSRPGLQIIITQSHCNGNSKECSICPLISSTGEDLEKCWKGALSLKRLTAHWLLHNASSVTGCELFLCAGIWLGACM